LSKYNGQLGKANNMSSAIPNINVFNNPKWVILTECPRDAMQGWLHKIPTAEKISYLNTLLHAEIDILDCGSFVSPKAIPQMADTKEVLEKLDIENKRSKLLVIVANERGAIEAVQHEKVSYVGFPFSISETFQQKNTNSTIEESIQLVERIQYLCVKHNKILIVYISMAFGNPYGNIWNETIVQQWVAKFCEMGITDIRLADTVGLATPEQVSQVTKLATQQANANVNIGLHLHAEKANAALKIKAGLAAGCIRFDTSIQGIGGCPLSGTDLIGNIDTQQFLDIVQQEKYYVHINKAAFEKASLMAINLFA
jgi:hydroxymethylglutaryl-CoA lyase